MTLYHATWKRHLPSIERHGLGGFQPDDRNFEGTVRGLYLCSDPLIAISFLIEALDSKEDIHHLPPPALLAQMRVIVIDDSRIENKKLKPDPQVERKDVAWLYDGVIDTRGMPILDVDTIMASVASDEDQLQENIQFGDAR